MSWLDPHTGKRRHAHASKRLSPETLDHLGVPDAPPKYTHPGFRVVWRRGYALGLLGADRDRCPYSAGRAINYRGVWLGGYRAGSAARREQRIKEQAQRRALAARAMKKSQGRKSGG